MSGFKAMMSSTNAAPAGARLETPRMMVSRGPVSETSLIGRRLGRVYDVASDLPGEMDVLLRVLDSKTAR